MKFYEDRASIVSMNEKQVYLFKNRDNEISMEYYDLDEGHKSISICKDAYGEFDTAEDGDEINLVYQNTENYLKLLKIDKFKVKDLNLPLEKLHKTYEIKVNINNGIKSIIYLLPKFTNKGVFEIHHHILKENKWNKFKVSDVKVSKFINPIKVLSYENTILLFFYNINEICLKEFHIESFQWKETVVLTDKLEKMYVDVIRDSENIHLVYSEHLDGNLSIKYKKYQYKDKSLLEIKDKTVSNKGNTTHPTLVLEGEKIWVIWKDSLGLNSCFSKDGGETFSNIYLWNKSKIDKYIKYDYIENKENTRFKLNSCFGTLYPEIRFLGFGILEDTEEIFR